MRSVIPKREVRRAGAAGPPLNVAALEAALREVVRGEVRFSDGDRALYATDASNYRQTPIGVVLPRDKRDVIQAVAVCHHYGAPVLARGGGTSLAGQDRKSTRLNSSHTVISYAVFCLKKKKTIALRVVAALTRRCVSYR